MRVENDEWNSAFRQVIADGEPCLSTSYHHRVKSLNMDLALHLLTSLKSLIGSVFSTLRVE
jgi:hypothetical protein